MTENSAPVYGVYRHCRTPYESDIVVGFYRHHEEADRALFECVDTDGTLGEYFRIREWRGTESHIIDEYMVVEEDLKCRQN